MTHDSDPGTPGEPGVTSGFSPASGMRLRPFFSFFGAKWRAASRYPAPRHHTIMEPFAGSAGYALRYPDRTVHLSDADPVIVAVWEYLIHTSAREIRSLPDLAPGQSVDDLDVTPEARWLIGFWVNKGGAVPCRTPSAWMRTGRYPTQFWGPEIRERVASQVDRIRHWTITHRSYDQCPDTEATWFVDPPYQGAGKDYRYGADRLDFAALASWCRSRPGQVIVCENDGATWLPFTPIYSGKGMAGSRRSGRSDESVWTRDASTVAS